VDYKTQRAPAEVCERAKGVLPARLTGTSLKFQRKVTQAIARPRHLSLMPLL
jgi:small subunit ribosomal protein S18